MVEIEHGAIGHFLSSVINGSSAALSDKFEGMPSLGQTHVLANSSGLGLAGSPRERLGAYLRGWARGQKARLAPRTVERYETFAAQVQQDALHGHVSVLLHRGVSLKEVQVRLGHASAQFTLSTYAHVLPGMETQAAAAVGAMLAGRPG